MEPVFLGIVAVAIACAGGLAIAFKDGGAENKRQEEELQSAFGNLFPEGHLSLSPVCRGSFGAAIKIGEIEYSFFGDYLEEEGGDGYMHVREKCGNAEKELFRVRLAGHKFHWTVLTEGIRSLAQHRSESHTKKPDQSPEPATGWRPAVAHCRRPDKES